MAEPVIRHVTVYGRVQGVGYRAFVERTARARGLEGWVRNRSDGSVEAVLAGPTKDIAQMIAGCRRGPPAARVDSVDERPGTADQLALRPAGATFAVLLTV